MSYAQYLSENQMENAKTNRLKWLLDKTLGAGGCFEYRRSELGLLLGVPLDQVTDDHVTESFIASIQPETGFMWRYLANAQIGVQIGNSLFIHGV